MSESCEPVTSEWLRECQAQIRQNVEGKYQNYLLCALEQHSTPFPTRKERYIYGPMKGKIRRQFCGNCGVELTDVCANYCSRCGRMLPLDWAQTWEDKG